MNQNAVMGILRAVVPAIIAYLVGAGIIPGDQAAALGSAILTIGAAGWSVVTNLETKPAVKP